MNRYLGPAVTLIVVLPGVALAQSARPLVELGIQLSEKTSGVGQFGQVLRLTVPLKPRSAIEATTDAANENTAGNLLNLSGQITSERGFSVDWRQTVFSSGRLQIFGVLGGGRNRVETRVPVRIIQGRVEEHTSVESELVAHVGSAVQVELLRWLALRGDLQGIIGQKKSGVRGMVGAVFQVPRFGAGGPPSAPTPGTPTATPNAAKATPPLAEWQRVKPGREVWVTTNTGSLVHGKVATISDSSLSVREQDREVTIRLDAVRLVEGRDSLKNGVVIGGASGGLVLGVLFAVALPAICESNPCTSAAEGFVVGAASGAAIGGLLGMMVDALIPGRQTLFGGSTTVVTPVITPNRKAIDVAIRWR